MLVRAQLDAQGIGRVHRCALAIRRAETGKSKPCFVPQENEVWLNGKTFLHHPFDVIDKTIKCAVSQQQHTHLIQLAGSLKVQQLFLDVAQRNRAVH